MPSTVRCTNSIKASEKSALHYNYPKRIGLLAVKTFAPFQHQKEQQKKNQKKLDVITGFYN